MLTTSFSKIYPWVKSDPESYIKDQFALDYNGNSLIEI